MQIYTKGVDRNEVLFLVPDENWEGGYLSRFARPEEPLVVVLKKDPAYQHPHLEIRKERS